MDKNTYETRYCVFQGNEPQLICSTWSAANKYVIMQDEERQKTLNIDIIYVPVYNEET